MNKCDHETNNAREFIAGWQKRYKITLHEVSEEMLQVMEEYAGHRRQQAAHPDVEQILNRVSTNEITPRKALELLEGWADSVHECSKGSER
jgi:hypothetical protein